MIACDILHDLVGFDHGQDILPVLCALDQRPLSGRTQPPIPELK
jgi:hypothetical protein